MALGLKVLQNYQGIQPSMISAQVVFPTTGNYTGGGEPCDLTAMTDPGLIGLIGPFLFAPLFVDALVMGTAGAYAQWTPGTTLKNGVLRLFSANGSEFSGAWGSPWDTTHSTVILNIYLNSLDQ